MDQLECLQSFKTSIRKLILTWNQGYVNETGVDHCLLLLPAIFKQ